MKFHPLKEQTQGPPGEANRDQAGSDLHEDLLILVPRMEVWGFVVSVVHVHDDSIEAAENRHTNPREQNSLIWISRRSWPGMRGARMA